MTIYKDSFICKYKDKTKRATTTENKSMGLTPKQLNLVCCIFHIQWSNFSLVVTDCGVILSIISTNIICYWSTTHSPHSSPLHNYHIISTMQSSGYLLSTVLTSVLIRESQVHHHAGCSAHPPPGQHGGHPHHQ